MRAMYTLPTTESARQNGSMGTNTNNKTEVIGIRISHETKDYIDEKSIGKSRGKVVEEIIGAYRELEAVTMWSDISVEEVCKQIRDRFMEGKIKVEEGEIKWEYGKSYITEDTKK